MFPALLAACADPGEPTTLTDGPEAEPCPTEDVLVPRDLDATELFRASCLASGPGLRVWVGAPLAGEVVTREEAEAFAHALSVEAPVGGASLWDVVVERTVDPGWEVLDVVLAEPGEWPAGVRTLAVDGLSPSWLLLDGTGGDPGGPDELSVAARLLVEGVFAAEDPAEEPWLVSAVAGAVTVAGGCLSTGDASAASAWLAEPWRAWGPDADAIDPGGTLLFGTWLDQELGVAGAIDPRRSGWDAVGALAAETPLRNLDVLRFTWLLATALGEEGPGSAHLDGLPLRTAEVQVVTERREASGVVHAWGGGLARIDGPESLSTSQSEAGLLRYHAYVERDRVLFWDGEGGSSGPHDPSAERYILFTSTEGDIESWHVAAR